MDDKLDKKTLEDKFAEDFSSPYFPHLAQIYLNEGDYNRAKKVCEIGLNNDANNVDGKFVFAKVILAEKKYLIAEKWLKQVINENPAHFNALRMLIKLEFQLNRSHKTIHKYLNHLLAFIPDDKEALKWLNQIKTSENNSVPIVKNEISDNEDIVIKTTKSKSAPFELKKGNVYNIEKSMSTFTMVQILKSQKHYQQSLKVLNELELMNQDKDKISKLREEINKLISEST